MSLFSAGPQLLPDVSAVERQQFDEAQRIQLLVRLRWGVLPVALTAVLMALIAPDHFPHAPAGQLRAVALGGGLCVFTALPLSLVPFVKRHPGMLATYMGLSSTICIAGGSAVTGGFESPILPVLFMVWIYGSVVAPLTAKSFVWNGVVMVSAFVATLLYIDRDIGSPLWATTLMGGAFGLCLVGAVLRDRAALHGFVTRARLDDLKAKLERRVQEQVVEILSRVSEVEALNTQLQEKVQERSRELAVALERLGRRDRADAVLSSGAIVGNRVRLIRLLGAGGMGTAYLADDLVTRQRVAMKVMHPHIAGDRSALQRFIAEAGLAAAVRHPAIAKIFHVDVTDEGQLYLVMEYVRGGSLARALAEKPYPPGECARLGSVVAEGIAAAHAAGVIHRDVKPANILLPTERPGIKIIDFGLSKRRQPEATTDGSPQLTHSNQLLGTPAYMSPEQVRDAGGVTTATDVYSLGLVLYEMLAGRRAFDAQTPAGFYAAHVGETPPELTRVAPAVSAPFARLVQACLNKEPRQRPSAVDVADTLRAFADAEQVDAAERLNQVRWPAVEDTTVAATDGAPARSSG